MSSKNWIRKETVEIIARVEGLINKDTVVSGRYSATTQAEIDTEQFA